jgi:hypothetical protein
MPLPLESNIMVPWHIRRKKLEDDDRKIAIMKRPADLESAVGIKS